MPAKSDPAYYKIVTSMGSLNEIGNYWQSVPNNSPSSKLDYMHEAGAVSRMMRKELQDSAAPISDADFDEENSGRGVEDSCSENECDMDVDMLILNVREKLKMGSRLPFNSSDLWTCKYLDNEEGEGEEDVEEAENDGFKGTKSAQKSTSNTSCVSEGNSKLRCGSSRLRHSNSSTSFGSQQQGSYNSKQIINGGISKSHHHRSPFWSSQLSQFSKKKFPQGYNLLQELLDSGSLIKEAVRRINKTGSLYVAATKPTESITSDACLSAPGFCNEADFSDIRPQIGSPVSRNIVC